MQGEQAGIIILSPTYNKCNKCYQSNRKTNNAVLHDIGTQILPPKNLEVGIKLYCIENNYHRIFILYLSAERTEEFQDFLKHSY